MPSKIYSCAVRGIDAYGVEIQVDILSGLSIFSIVGLGDTAVQESRDRIRSAMVNSGATFPLDRKVVNLAPADTRKYGPGFDLPMAVGLLVESGQVGENKRMTNNELRIMGEAIFLGELGLDGEVKPVQGILSCALWAKENKVKTLYVPQANVEEALLIKGLNVIGVPSLKALIAHLKGFAPLPVRRGGEGVGAHTMVSSAKPDFRLLEGLKGGRIILKALAVAAAGGHHLLMSGPPGSGKTLLAQALPLLLPPLSEEEAIELTRLYSVAGLLPPQRPWIRERPFRSLHSTASLVSLIGGGNTLRPGEISLAHRGVLFLDELPEFPRPLLESLRQPLEDRTITVSRSAGSVRFPASFILVGSMNPCPCGHFGDAVKRCICTSSERLRYQKKLSGPLLDRMDLRLHVLPLSSIELTQPATPPNNLTLFLQSLYEQVLCARRVQAKRYGLSTMLNADLAVANTQSVCELGEEARGILQRAAETFRLSARGYHRTLKVARTLADMEGDSNLTATHVLEALQYRVATAI